MRSIRIQTLGGWLACAVTALALTLSAAAQVPYVIGFDDLEVGHAHPRTAYDYFYDRDVVVSLRQASALVSDLYLDVTVRSNTSGPVTHVYGADFLDFKYADFEIVDVLADGKGYTIFLNKFHTVTERWSSWALRIDSTTFNLSWSKQFQLGGEGAFTRVTEVTRTKGGYALLVASEDTIIGSETVVAWMDSNANIGWANTYAFAEPVEPLALSFGSGGLMVGGWISDLDSNNIAEVALFELDINDGSLLGSAHYNDVWVDFHLAMAKGAGSAGAGTYLAGFLENQVVFFTVNKDLVAGVGTLVDTEYPEEFVFISSGDLMATTRSYSGGGAVLTVPGPLVTGTGLPFVSDVAASFGIASADLTSIDRAEAGALIGGEVDWSAKIPAVAMADASGELDYCVPVTELAPRSTAMIATQSLGDCGPAPQPLTTTSQVFYYYGGYDIGDRHLCH